MDKSNGTVDVRTTFQKLRLLDLPNCHNVGDIVEGMRHCSFGARMFGEVAETLCQWMTTPGKQPIIIYDGRDDRELATLLRQLSYAGFAAAMCTSTEYAQGIVSDDNILVVGPYMERNVTAIMGPTRAIFINPYGQARPHQIRDGYFPDVIFSDPRFVLPIIAHLVHVRAGKEEPTTALQIVREGWNFGGLAQEVAQAVEVLHLMLTDKTTTVFGTISGALSIAKFGLVVCDMLDGGWIQHLSTTGAFMAHGLIEGVGLTHYKYDPTHSDELLAAQGINRVTDTLEPEENFDHIEKVVAEVLDNWIGDQPITPTIFHRQVGQYLALNYPEERGILKSAFIANVPVATPAFCDSEIGNDVFVHNVRRQNEGKKPILMDMEGDSRLLMELATRAERLGIFSIGGGVPRNNTQNVAPLIEIYNNRLGTNLPKAQFYYGVRIDPTPMYYGNLSGCTYSEGGSWRKMDFNGKFAEVHADATIVLPFIVKAVMESLK